MNLTDMIRIDQVESAGVLRQGDVQDLVNAKVAESVQTRLRGTLSHGIASQAGIEAQAVRVKAQGDRLIINTEDPAGSLRGRPQAAAESSESSESRSADGSIRMVFRQADISKLPAAQLQSDQDAKIRDIVGDTIKMSLVDFFDEAVREVESRHPEDKL